MVPNSDELDERTNAALSFLEALADQWEIDAHVTEMIKNIVAVARLTPNASESDREQFIGRMEAQIDAIINLAFVEGAWRGYRAALELANPDKP